jgi:hypothetical protein
VSHYEDELYISGNSEDNEKKDHHPITLHEIIKKRHSAAGSAESQKIICSRCHHGNATMNIAQVHAYYKNSSSKDKKKKRKIINFLLRKTII